ncbi:ABC transporter ATP-binding protein [Gordonia jinhuaensis]|uniref:ABC transporter ATP-binding protein n=1 Tax=Gordonia jinhuaensis TaxID=1517702 RepID=A0A916T9T4_9ACTN|nr:ABC transporter ATP-binding protein [Gordonia jinhuaensis]GGB36934.1 ABC transporter ATP-binding protein [Gordonia jinhuaensis]
MNTTAIRATGLSKEFKGQHGSTVRAVDGIDLSIDAGEVVAFLGPNGAGKTTTIDMILGLSEPTSGSVEVFGRPATETASTGRVAAVTQTGGLLADYTVEEMVRVVASIFASGAPDREIPDVADAMARANITGIADRKVSKCSGGEQQRLKFALALLPDPDLIVLDEPTAGMDVESRRAFWAAMRADAGQGRTVLFATHYLEEADDFADRIVMIAHGKVVADGSADSIRAQASGRTVSAIIDDADLDTVRVAVPTLTDITRRGGRAYLTCADSDALARYLLANTGARDLEITAHNLEDAFVALTSDASDPSDSAEPFEAFERN